MCECLCAHSYYCVGACVCARMGVRARASVHSCARASVVCRSIDKRLCACVCLVVCVRVARLRVRLGGCVGAVDARLGPSVLIARPAAPGGRVRGCGLLRSALGVARVGRRCDVDEPHDQRAVGCATTPHVRDRRRLRRHLRHRRPSNRRQLQHHPLQRRLGEHRRRCAGRTRSGGCTGWVLPGVLRDTWWELWGTTWGTKR